MKENIQLKRHIEEYEKHWMAKLDGERASYFIELGKSLSNGADRKQKENKTNMSGAKLD
ncbi:unnamed protein product [Rotaria socialis]|uniref:Uncharacterized protein n=1 Tax=Rotaria socialis TaxID=392032 RepID=A0A820L5R0_9BILA|nr:unnamed protein product [Rotaria socialis]